MVCFVLMESSMPLEIERKFLVDAAAWPRPERGTRIVQGYMPVAGDYWRIRIAGHTGFLTIKRAVTELAREEDEFCLPVAEALRLLEEACPRPWIQKIRYEILHNGHLWQVDEFEAENHGLVMAEVELEREDEPLSLPPWVTIEVSRDPRYFNSYLARHPYNTWP